MPASSERSGRSEPAADQRLLAIAYDLLRFTPAVQAIRPGSSPGLWADDLRALVQTAEAEPLREDVEAILRANFGPTSAFSDVFERHRWMPMAQIVAISNRAVFSERTHPLAAHTLATLCLTLVAGQLPVLQESGPVPHWSRWFEVSYACLVTALRVGAIWPARRLVDFTHGILDATKITFRHEIEGELARCLAFARSIQRKVDIAISNLADDLRESCRTGTQTFRAETGAIAWTLGMVPESAIFRVGSASSHVVPSRRFFRRLVCHSLACIPRDALLQYIWLEMKDRPPFDVRSHESLFAVINHRYEESPLESEMLLMMSLVEPPARRYARALIGLFRGDLDPKEAQECGGFWYHAVQGVRTLDAARVYLLLDFLSGAPPAPVHPEIVRDWMKMIAEVRELRRGGQMNAAGEPLLSRAAVPRFYLADALQSAGRTAELLDAEEEWRAVGLTYWLAVTPPRLDDAGRGRLERWLEDERTLMTLVRGAYFEMLRPGLPRHYWRFAFHADDPASGPRPSAIRGRDRHTQLVAQLADLRDEMARHDPGYRAIRPDAPPGLNRLTELLRSGPPPVLRKG